MTSTVTTPSRPLSAGCHRRTPRRSAPAVLSLGGGPRRRAPATSCSALASPEKQSTAKLPPPQPRTAASRTAAPEEEETDYNEVAATLESIYKLSPALVEEKDDEDEKNKKAKRKKKGRVVSTHLNLQTTALNIVVFL